MNDQNCLFCKNIPNTSDSIDSIKKRILFESDNFIIFPTLGQFTEGYLLIASKTHYRSSAFLPKNIFEELETLTRETRKILHDKYGPIILFEHGSLNAIQSGGCCIDHFHFHILPFNGDISSHLNDFPKKQIYYLKEIKNQVDTSLAYLFYENNYSQKFIYNVGVIPSQYLRKIISQEIGKSGLWDWRIHPEIENLKNTYSNLKNLFNELLIKESYGTRTRTK